MIVMVKPVKRSPISNKTARQALAEVRQAVLGYRDQGLAHELRGAQNALESADVVFESTVEAGETLPPAIENVVALALREAVTNIIRHSDAKHCRFHLQQIRDRIHVTIADDGNLTSEKKMRLNGKWLERHEERVRVLQGELQIEWQGLTLRLSLPLHAAEVA